MVGRRAWRTAGEGASTMEKIWICTAALQQSGGVFHDRTQSDVFCSMVYLWVSFDI